MVGYKFGIIKTTSQHLPDSLAQKLSGSLRADGTSLRWPYGSATGST